MFVRYRCLSNGFALLVLGLLRLSGAIQSFTHDTYPSEPDVCDQESLMSARRELEQKNYGALIGHPCVKPEDLQSLRDGTRDPEDNFEILGTMESDESVVPVSQRNLPPSFAPKPGYKPMLPKVLYLGLEHTGSTSLMMQMNMHPELSFGQMKEHKMFQYYDGQSIGQFRTAYGKTFLVNTSAVKATFDGSPNTFIFGYPGDKPMSRTPIGKYFHMGEQAVSFIKDVIGQDAKLICMIRDPIDWILSMARDIPPAERTTVDFLLGAQNGKLANHSCYVHSLQTWMRVFPQRNFLFLKSEDYFRNPQSTLNRIFDFLGVPRHQYEQADFAPQGRRRNTVKASAYVRQRYFQDSRVRECQQRLSQLTHTSWAW